jgi:hypothetical protein
MRNLKAQAKVEHDEKAKIESAVASGLPFTLCMADGKE